MKSKKKLTAQDTPFVIMASGDGFKPGRYAYHFPYDLLAESGKTASIGRYKGYPSPYGMVNVYCKTVQDVITLVNKFKRIPLVENITISIYTEYLEISKPFSEGALYFEKKDLAKIVSNNEKDIHFEIVKF